MAKGPWRDTEPGRRELDLHGLDRVTALQRLRDTMEGCRRDGVFRFRVIHGKGTGVLRETVWFHLRDHPAVSDLRPCPPRHGGEGATDVVLRRR